MRILALDISSVSTGFAVLDNNKLVKKGYGLIEMKQKLHGERLAYFEDKVCDLFEKYEPTHFFIEDVYSGPNRKTFKILCFYHGVAHKVSFKYLKKGPQALSPSEVRKIIGKRHDIKLFPTRQEKKLKKISSKEMTFDFIKKQYRLRSFTFEKSNDVTDAIALGLSAYYSIGAYHAKSV